MNFLRIYRGRVVIIDTEVYLESTTVPLIQSRGVDWRQRSGMDVVMGKPGGLVTLTEKEEVVKTSIERDRERKRAFTVTGFLLGLRISGHNPPTHFYACFTWLDGRLSGGGSHCRVRRRSD